MSTQRKKDLEKIDKTFTDLESQIKALQGTPNSLNADMLTDRKKKKWESLKQAFKANSTPYERS